MKRVLMVLMVLVLSSLVVAQSSETSTTFNIGSVEAGQDYVPSVSFWDVYGSYVIGLVIVLIIVIVFLKSKGPKVSRKRKTKRRVKRRK
jgi:hypothetical protein